MKKAVSDEVLRSLEPVFKNKIDVFENVVVQKIRADGKQRPCFFVVSAAGVHLIRKKKLKYKLSCSLSYSALTSIFVSGDKGSFGSNARCIRIAHENMREIAMLVYSIRVALFPVSRLPLDVVLDQELQWVSPYNTERALHDRLASCLMFLNAQAPIDAILEAIPFRDHVLHITSNTLKGEGRKAMYMAMLFTEDLTTLSFESVVFIELFPELEYLLKWVPDIQSVVFDRVDFQDAKNTFLMAMQSGHTFFPARIVFCETTFETSEFFSVLEFLGHRPQHLEFRRCVFHGDSLETTTAFLNKQLFWKELKSLVVSDADAPAFSERLNCIDLPNLESVAVDGSSVDVSHLLEAPLVNSIHMRSLVFNHAVFEKPVVLLPPQIRELDMLDLSDTVFSKEGLLCVFDWVSKLSRVRELNLSNLVLHDDLTDVLMELADVKTCVKSLLFTGNLMNCEQTKLFCRFVSQQPHLRRLAVGDSIDVSDTLDGITDLFATIKASKLTSVSFASHNPERVVGRNLVPFLEALIEINRVEELDIGNQPIGEDGIKVLIRVIKDTVLERLYFDGINVPSLDYLLGLCNAAVCSNMKDASWPAREFERLIPTEADVATRTVIDKTIETLKVEFVKEFEATKTRKRGDKAYKHALESDIPDFDVAVMTKRNPGIESLFVECTEATEDPLIPILLEFSESLSLDSLCRRLQNAQ